MDVHCRMIPTDSLDSAHQPQRSYGKARSLWKQMLVHVSLIILLPLCTQTLSAQQHDVQWQQATLESNQSAQTQLNDVLAEGLQLESEAKWGQALSLYQQALRDAPDIT